VPKRVDHEERRRQIADALLRTAAARGLHATGMREVAAEAGVSLRLVQYYFGTKEELLLSGMQHLAAQFGERAMTRIRRIKQPGGQASPRDVIAAILAEALPVDDERRTFAVLNAAYFALSLTDPALAVAPLVRNSNAVIDVITAQLRAAQAAGDTPARLDPDAEALGLLAMAHGLATSVLGGQSSAEQAQSVIDYHLDRLFPASRPALRRAPAEIGGELAGAVACLAGVEFGVDALCFGCAEGGVDGEGFAQVLACVVVLARCQVAPGQAAVGAGLLVLVAGLPGHGEGVGVVGAGLAGMAHGEHGFTQAVEGFGFTERVVVSPE
jgi:AcrR family transcriptional regulator